MSLKNNLHLLLPVIISTIAVHAQKVDSIFFNLYTDSLKKGTYNYINVEGKLSNGHFTPLTSKELTFVASAGKFDGNSLFIDINCSEEKITVKTTLKANPAMRREIIIYVKKKEE